MKLEEMSNEELIQAIQEGSQEAKDVFVTRNQPLVYALAKRFVSSRIPFEELVQIGCVGLMKALNHFDLRYQVKFSTYAVPIILGEIKRFFRDDGSIRISRSMKENYLQMLKVREQLQQNYGREVSYEEIAQACHLEVEDVILAFEANQFTLSFDEVIYENDGSPILLEDKVADEKQKDVTLQVSLRQEIARLSQREQLLLHYRYDLGMKQEEIAQRLHVSQVQVSRLERKVLEKLKNELVNT
ncbi:sigma-70 family RNA polymerase sigma factor [Merdibacter massiliensis]|uniref:sigma-70 family RNA polymerase sigma factor n=1 Tax=Merdibacter massiliensis TaxID=1871030 RepID=UPI001F43EC5A|nr:sigma-70 family RNA polymerase sigma factor [Merdibacter massiliensis]